MDIRILLVEDDEDIREAVKAYLVDAGYAVDASADGDEAMGLFYDYNYHLVILDILLPGTDGHQLLKEFRKLHDSPVMMLTALDDTDNEIRAFINEADDYVTKPFSMQVLLKRVDALLRRSGALQKEIRTGSLTLYPETCRVEYNGMEIPLTPKEFDILKLMALNRGRIISHDTLITKIWGYSSDVTEGVVHVNIKRLRDKFPVNIIKTVKGAGYRLEADI